MSISLQYLVHFIQHRVSKIIYYNTRVQSVIIKQRIKNNHLAKGTRIHLCPPEESSTQGLTSQGASTIRVK
jgi:hypothetical protein